MYSVTLDESNSTKSARREINIKVRGTGKHFM